MSEQAITTVDELPAELREELVAKRKAGTTLAELRKQYPQYTSEQIREALPALPKQEAKTPRRTRKVPAKAQPEETPKRTRGRANAQPAETAKTPAKAKAERKPIDGRLAQRAVTMRGKLDDRGRPTSWAKIGYTLKLVPEGAPKSQAGDAARRAYRQVKGADAPTGPSDY